MASVSLTIVVNAIFWTVCHCLAQEDILAFQNWFASAGGIAPNVRLELTPERGIGIVAKRSLAEGDEILRVPRSIVLSRQTYLDPRSTHQHGLSRAAIEALSSITNDIDLLSLLLLRELSQGSASEWAPYLQLLKGKIVPLPSALPETRIQELFNAPLADRILEDKSAGRARHESLFHILRMVLAGSPGAANLETLDAFLWADDLVQSRALDLAGVRALVPFADFMNYAPHPGAPETHPGELFEKYHAMEAHFVSVRTDRMSAAGGEIFEDYGVTNFEVFMRVFGFVPEDSAYECLIHQLPVANVQMGKGKGSEACLQARKPLAAPIREQLHIQTLTEADFVECDQLIEAYLTEAHPKGFDGPWRSGESRLVVKGTAVDDKWVFEDRGNGECSLTADETYYGNLAADGLSIAWNHGDLWQRDLEAQLCFSPERGFTEASAWARLRGILQQRLEQEGHYATKNVSVANDACDTEDLYRPSQSAVEVVAARFLHRQRALLEMLVSA